MTRPTHPPRTTPNRLAQETSPYLLQHAHNPVDWYPWGEEALRRAQQEDKPILLSIGYSSCHWCHVMERESFADPAIAELMNRHFVNVKVDREERPDLDEIYMQATLTLNHGQGGWPMTVFLTPDQKPFFAGTYFPPQDKYGRPGFPTLLRKIAETWEQDREALTQQGEQLTEHLRRAVTPVPPRGVGEREIEAAVADLTREYDPVYGGFGGAPKFPPSGAILLLLRHYHHTGTELSKEMAENTLEKMARGGMYDQIGGGFCRYSVDERWLVPHFEKMLYDNALLLRAYLEGWQVSGRPMFARIAREICDYILREMTDAGGGFYSATDADSEGEEGKFFVWTPEEVEAHLSPEDAALVCDYYDITPQGNWEGNSIPNVPQELEDVAQRHGCTPQEAWTRLMAAREVLYRVRDQRVHPGLDDKILTSWNGLMIGALAEAGRVLSDPALVAAAQRAADFIFEHMRRPDGRLFRTHRHGVSHLDAYLEDYAFLADACVDLFEAGGRPQDLERAHQLAQHMLDDFYDQSGGAFFSTSHHHEDLILRRQDAQDGAIPSANAIAAQVLARLSYHLDAPQLRDTAASVLKSFGRMIARVPRAFVRSLLVLDFLQRGPTELAVVGRQGREAMLEEIARHYVPNRLIAVGEGEHPLLRGKAPLDQRATLYICRNYACQAPLSDPQAVEVALRQHKSEPPAVDPLGARLAGRATAEGTATLAARGPVETGYNRLGRTGLTVSRVGFGAYRVEEDEPEHRLALQQALDEGCNLIDTSSNYTAGGSESTIGEVLLERSAEGRLDRAETVVVTKIGYVQGDNLTRARELQEEGQGIPEMVPYADDCWHCIHPDYLADQLERSLARLQLQTVDVVLLHNPEYYLMHARKTGGSRDAAREELYRRLARAFAYLEAQVEQGRVAWYGVSSNTVAYAPDHPEALSLPRMLEAAQLGGGRGNHFAVLQLPLNLVEAGAVRQEHHDGVTVLELARANEMGVLVNRPLNAFAAEGLLRLGPVPEAEVEPAVPTQEALVDLEEREERLGKQLDLQVRDSDGRVLPMAALFSWGQQLRQLRGQLSGILHWRQVEAQAIRPQLLRVLRLMDASLPPEQASIWRREREGYLQALNAALAALRYEAAKQSQAQLRPLVEAVHQNVPRVRQGESLSRLALWTVMSTPGVSAVLNGMRHPQYVKDSLAVLAWDPLPEPEAVFRAVATALA